MKEILFINTDEKAIEQTLKKIDKGKLDSFIKMRELQPPKKLARFRIKWNGKRGSLEYKYTNLNNKYNHTYDHIMTLSNEELPDFGWSIEKS